MNGKELIVQVEGNQFGDINLKLELKNNSTPINRILCIDEIVEHHSVRIHE